MNKNLIKEIFLVLMLALLGYLALLRWDRLLALKEKELLNNAVDNCSKNSRYIKDNGDGSKTETFIDWYYQLCLKEKGYR